MQKFNNILLQELNSNIFNGIVYLLYNLQDFKLINDLRLNISGIILNKRNNIYIISFNKYLKLFKYINIFKIYNPLINILHGNLYWLILKNKL